MQRRRAQHSPAAGAQQQLFAAGNAAAGATAGEGTEQGAVGEGGVEKGGLGLAPVGQCCALGCCSDQGHDECNLGRCFCHFTPIAAVLLEAFSYAAAGATDGSSKG